MLQDNSLLQDATAHLRAHADRHLADLLAFAAIPSVSTDPAYQEGMAAAADWVSRRMKRAGLEQVQVLPTGRHPVVYGEWLHAGDAPTLLIYGHYDVQPPDPLDAWQSPPFAPTVREGRVYARGVSDDKGPMLIPILVAEAFLHSGGQLPVNVKFMFEGEEEIGSPSLAPFAAAHGELLAADFVLSADGAMWRSDLPSVIVASRGLVGLNFTVTGAAKDLHSGRHGGGIANPLHALARLVASLHDEDGRVAVEGFYSQVEELSPQERQAIQAIPFDEEQYLADVGAPALVGEPGYTLLERHWIRPTLDVNGLWGGYQGAGGKTVIPHAAHAKLTCRLVPAQDPADIAAKIAAHLEAHLPPGVDLSVEPAGPGVRAYALPRDHPGLLVAEQVLGVVDGQSPVRVRLGGTLPAAEVFLRELGVHTIFFSFSTADEDFHAPNEFFRLQRFYTGMEAWARYWTQTRNFVVVPISD